MSDMDKYCKNCRFFDDGRCRRYPPKVAQVGVPGRAKWVQHLPLMNDDDYCGEFERRVGEARSKTAIDSIPAKTASSLFRSTPENA